MSSGFVRITKEDVEPGEWEVVRSRAGRVYANHYRKAVQICLNGGMDSVAPGVYSAQFGICEERYMGRCTRVSVWPDSTRGEPDEARVTKMADILSESPDIHEDGVLARAQGPSFVYLYVALETRDLGVTWTICKDSEKVYHISCMARSGYRPQRLTQLLPDRESLHSFVNGDGAQEMAARCREGAGVGKRELMGVL